MDAIRRGSPMPFLTTARYYILCSLTALATLNMAACSRLRALARFETHTHSTRVVCLCVYAHASGALGLCRRARTTASDLAPRPCAGNSILMRPAAPAQRHSACTCARDTRWFQAHGAWHLRIVEACFLHYAPPRLSSVSRRTRRLYAFLSCMNNSAASGFAGLPQLGSVSSD